MSKSLQLLGIFLVLDYISGGTIQVYWYPTFLLPAGPDFWMWCEPVDEVDAEIEITMNSECDQRLEKAKTWSVTI